MHYKPDPIDTSSLKLTPEILELTERLARNVHDVWARQRLRDGWSYGPKRDDRRREHPGLIAYDELPDSEKEYDRQTALETIRMLLALGCTIGSPDHSRTGPVATISSPGSKTIDATASAPFSELLRIWITRDTVWSSSAGSFASLGARLLQTGDPLFAYDVACEGLKHFPSHIRLRQLLGLALGRARTPAAANQVLLALYNEGCRDEETIGLLARTFKDLADESFSETEKILYLRKAFELYAASYRSHASYWTGINAATTALLSGEHNQAVELARDVRDLCMSRLSSISPEEAYWHRATIAEACLVLRELTRAEEWYTQAVEASPKSYGDIHSTRRNARMIVKYLQLDASLVENCLRLPAVAVFSGHMIDRPDRAEPRFPPRLEPAVRGALDALLRRRNVGFGYSSAACGSDILFLEAVFDLKGEACVVLPYEKSSFIRDSAEVVPGGNWGARCDDVLENAARVTICSDRVRQGSHAAYEYSNLMLRGLGLIRARLLDTQLIPVVVWDGKSGDGPGGTASMAMEWTKRGFQVEQINTAEMLRERIVVRRTVASAPPEGTGTDSSADFVASVKSLLFADAHGFSKLTENEVPLFVKHFLGMVGALADSSPHAPIAKNTWGDGLYFVFANVRDAGLFALQLCDRIEQIDWPECGLGDLKVRIGLHAGPVYSCLDPVTHRLSYVGAHVSRAARIEPVTPLGQVYASEPFAALAADDGVQDFACEYVGQVALSKSFGTFPTFAVRRQRCSPGAREDLAQAPTDSQHEPPGEPL